MAIASVILLWKKTAISLQLVFPLNKEIPRMIKMVLDLFVRTIALNTALIFAVKQATNYGTDALAAYGIGIQIWLFGAFFIDGYSSAGNILSGKLFGAKKYSTLVRLANHLSFYGFFTGLVLAGFGFLFYQEIGAIFIQEASVLNRFDEVFWIILIMQPLCGIMYIHDGIFKGLGKTAFLRNLLLVATFGVFIPSALIFNHFDFKLYGIWYTFILWVIARGLPLYIDLRTTFSPLAEKL
jgi:Na+-driven multidrug efflux pump